MRVAPLLQDSTWLPHPVGGEVLSSHMEVEDKLAECSKKPLILAATGELPLPNHSYQPL